MAITLTIQDESTLSQIPPYEVTLDFPNDRITVRELIETRVFVEVHNYNQKEPEYFRGLVAPSDAEQTLNGYKMKEKRKIDWRAQCDAAINAFNRQQYLILVDDRQAEALEEEILINPKTKISFLKLIPLVGG